MANERIRKMAKEMKVPLWKIAEYLRVSEPTMTRKLRKELPKEEQDRIVSIIREKAGHGE